MSMKYAAFISILTLAATMSFAGGFAAPESSVPTPAERLDVSKGTPDLGAKESAEWQKMRAERKQAREQILSKIRESSSAEKQVLRQDVSKNRNENSRFEGKPQKMQPRERQPFYERSDSPTENIFRGHASPNWFKPCTLPWCPWQNPYGPANPQP